MSLSREKTMRVALRFALAAAVTIGALAPAFAQQAAEQESAKAAVRIPPAMLRYYCVAGSGAYSIGAVVCISRGQWGTCKWTNSGSNHSAPPNRAYWISSVAPNNVCP
jgi:hypothetical protein